LLGIPYLLRHPKYHQFWTTQKGADHLSQTAYQAVRLLLGDIRPEQFLTGAGEEDGFFDALSAGPVSATDPRALGGDLVSGSFDPER
jgi:conjugal transfer pilus assembly protein TraF